MEIIRTQEQGWVNCIYSVEGKPGALHHSIKLTEGQLEQWDHVMMIEEGECFGALHPIEGEKQVNAYANDFLKQYHHANCRIRMSWVAFAVFPEILEIEL